MPDLAIGGECNDLASRKGQFQNLLATPSAGPNEARQRRRHIDPRQLRRPLCYGSPNGARLSADALWVGGVLDVDAIVHPPVGSFDGGCDANPGVGRMSAWQQASKFGGDGGSIGHGQGGRNKLEGRKTLDSGSLAVHNTKDRQKI